MKIDNDSDDNNNSKSPDKPKHKVDHRNWKERFFKTVPMVGADGEPIPQDPPLNKDGFWDKPKDTARMLRGATNKYKK